MFNFNPTLYDRLHGLAMSKTCDFVAECKKANIALSKLELVRRIQRENPARYKVLADAATAQGVPL